MRITFIIGNDTLRTDGRRIVAQLPYANADHVVVDMACPSCAHDAPLKLRGRNQYHDHDTYHATAVALCCRTAVGKLEVKVSTVFGIDEDERVTRGPWRVY